MNSIDVNTIEDLRVFANQLAKRIEKPVVIALYGNLGSGKTTLVKELANVLGFNQTVSSPTYSLVNIYDNDSLTINHLDLYRLSSLEEAFGLGIEEILDQNAITLIEWPEIIEEILPEQTIKLYFSLSDGNRIIDYE